MPPTLYLIDGHALAYRSYFALTGAGAGSSRWTTSSGEPTAGVFGFASVLLRILEQDRPDYLAVAFDVGKTFRDEIYPEYKGTREKMPDDLRTQIERMRELVDALNIPRLEMPGYEADDVLGSVAKNIAEQGIGVKIITGDKDLLQLVTERIIVNLPGRQLADSKDYNPEDVKANMGVRPDQIVDYKAMVGDKSDNIPGIVGVGKKTAEVLLGEYETLDGIYENLADLKPAQISKFEADRENAYMSQKLAQIVTDLDIDVDLDKARPDHFKPSDVQQLFRELEFRTLMKRLATVMDLLGVAPSAEGDQPGLFDASEETTQPSELDSESIIVDSPEALADLAKILKKAKIIAFDTETTGTDQMEADLVGISLAVEAKKGYYIPVGHAPEMGAQLSIEEVIEAIRAPMTDPKIPKAGHNLSYDYVILARYGLECTPLSFDTMVAEWVRDTSSRNLGLKNLAWVRLNIGMTDIDELIGTGRKQITMAEVPIEKAAPYAVADAEVILRLKPLLEEDLKKVDAVKLFEDLDMPAVPVLSQMVMAGISLDEDFLSVISAKLEKELAEIAEQVYKLVGEEFNLNSPQKLSHALFEQLKIEPPDGTRKTASGHYSTAAEVLEALRDEHEIVNWVMSYRELAKLKSTYVDALPKQINPRTGRVHTSYNQTGSVTGRIASSEPNLQNIPIRTERGRQVRQAFVASPGNMLLAVDYSQIELRVVAHIANDKAMIDAFKAGQDIHATTAAAILGKELKDVNKDDRRNAKAVNFGLIYGMSAFGLTRSTELTLAEAQDFVKAYFERFPGIRTYLDETKELATEQGYVETLLGRRRHFPGLRDGTNAIVRSRLEREAINSPIQGTAADIMKLAMLRVAEALKKSDLKSQMLLQVHDELVLDCPEDELRATAKLVSEEMSKAYTLKVPLQTEMSWGRNWREMETLEL
jgi:DNA polymerase-1